MTAPERANAIQDYGIIGDCASAALVGRDGSIDWLCWPEFHAPSVFARLLDAERGGAFSIDAEGVRGAHRAYVPRTNVLQTELETRTGVLRVTDAMPVDDTIAYRTELWPEHQILRRVECLAGEVVVRVRCEPRPDYGRRRARFDDRGALGFFCRDRGLVLVVRSEIPLRLVDEGGRLEGEAVLRAGERRWVAISQDSQEPAVLPVLGDVAERRLVRTIHWWRRWAAQCRYEGPWRDKVLRSALALKLLGHAPSGAFVAAPTTSLPETIGGDRNWDYRYCWLRDAALTVRALLELGFEPEGRAFFDWILHATRRSLPRLDIVYDVFGKSRLPEEVLEELAGHRGSRPVRVGNDAHAQLQLDIYGEVVTAAVEYVVRGGQLDDWQRRMLAKIGREVCRRWQEPDNGIWEVRSGRRRHTHSAVMCWVALENLLGLSEAGLVAIDRPAFTRVRDEIRDAIETNARGSDGGYVAWLGGDSVDASLLMATIHGYAGPDHAPMARTFERIERELTRGPFVQRYGRAFGDGLSSDEGAFGICSFWAVEYLTRAGRTQEARRRFDQLLGCANDLGLFGEEIDPRTGAPLGNFPQGFTHVGLINAALALAGRGRVRRGQLEPGLEAAQ